MAEIPKDGLSKEILEKMYNEVINVSYDTAEQNPKNKGIMLYEAEKILDVMKKYLFNERV
jgi:cAMP phosphodiesterase